MNAHETLAAKARYKQEARTHGVVVESYHSDNGIFAAREFTKQLLEHGQEIKFSGVGAKYQNGCAELSIKTATYMARSMMLHSAIRWPEVYDTTFWPYALSYACYIYNQLPKKSSGMSPQEIWQGVKEDHAANLGAVLLWGCPTYVLAAKLQDRQKLPKWKPRSR